MENFIRDKIDFEDKELSQLVNCLCHCYNNNQINFAKICFTIYKIWAYCKGNYFKAKNNEYYNSYKLLAKFGIDKKAVSRYKQCFEKFIQCNDNDIEHLSVKPYFYYFSPSKLFELLPLSDDTIYNAVENKLITPDMTCKQIREYIRTLKDGTDKAEKVVEDTTINEEEIPIAYNPKQEYEFSYFEAKTKNQLLNIVWELQKEYQALKLKGERKNAKQSNK